MNRILLERLAVVGLLFVILVLSFYARSLRNAPDQMLSYDPIFQYRFTKYFVDFGELPLWDELSYYTGRAVITTAPPMLFYLTALVHAFVKNLGWSLMTTATFASAWYGAFIVIPAFLLAREMSNKWGGLLGAALTGLAPQILVRTFGASFDTDQLAIFFILLTLWAGIYALKRRDVFSVTLAVACFIAFAVAWNMFWYTFFFMVGAAAIYVLMGLVGSRFPKLSVQKFSMKDTKALATVLVSVFVLVSLCAALLGIDPILYFTAVMGFAQEAEKQIVNISIAELQSVNLSDLDTLMSAAGRFSTGDKTVDNMFFLAMICLMLFGLKNTYEKDRMNFAFLATILLMAFYSLTRGIRFTEFSSGLLIAAAAVGFGQLTMWVKDKDSFLKGFAFGLGLFLAIFGIFIGFFSAQYLGPDTSQPWEDAWTYLRTRTPELSLVGTWWDPGHMITGKAERRVIADGAHCGFQCLYGINDRITALGKIMATDDENVSLQLIRKYQGTSPKVYWIASDDLISKYQWLQYFGMGCDSRSDARCQLYSALSLENVKYDTNGNAVVFVYGPIMMVAVGEKPALVYVQGKNAALIDEVMYYNGNSVITRNLNNENKTDLASSMDPLMKQLGYRMSDQSVSLTGWLSKDSRTIIIIPPTLRNTVFTRMFFLEGQGLEHFKQVFRNEQVKIYEVIF